MLIAERVSPEGPELLQIEKLYFSQEISTEESQQEIEMTKKCLEQNVTVEAIAQATLIRESDLNFLVQEMPFIFTDFRKKVEARLKIQAPAEPPAKWPRNLLPRPRELEHESVLKFSGGETAALKRLNEFIWKTDSVQNYKESRNGLLELNDSSKFSPWLSQGCLSPRKIYSELKTYEEHICKNDSTYWLFFELLWRDYFKFFSQKFGRQIFLEAGVRVSPSYKPVKDEREYLNWMEGQTSEPFVNAKMLELKHTGWMSNRGRQNVASFLFHQLKLPWTWGAKYFEKMLLDYDPDVNWGNWLYFSGKGSDPRARLFNIRGQADRYDPDQKYQKQWLKGEV